MSDYPRLIRARLSDLDFDKVCEDTNRRQITISEFIREAVGEKLEREQIYSPKDFRLIRMRREAKEMEGKLAEFQRQIDLWRRSGSLSIAGNVVDLAEDYPFLAVPDDVRTFLERKALAWEAETVEQ